MSVAEHLDSKHQAMLGRLAFLDTGTGVARVRIYAGTRPAVTDAPPIPFIVELPLLDPSGSVSNGVLTLSPGGSQLNTDSGVAAWARVVNGNGDTAFDCTVTDLTGTGEIKIQNTTLYVGGETRMVSGVMR